MTTIDQLQVRRAEPDDAGTVMTLLGELAEHQGQSDSVQVTTEGYRTLLERPDVVVLIAERAGEPVGYVSATRSLNLWAGRDIMRLDDLYVRPDARAGGVGGVLMAEMARLAAAEQMIVRWEAEVDNEPAHRFYGRLGARLRTKVIAAWTPDRYASLVSQGSSS